MEKEDVKEKDREMVNKKNKKWRKELAYISVIIDSFLDFWQRNTEALSIFGISRSTYHLERILCIFWKLPAVLLRMDMNCLKNNHPTDGSYNITKYSLFIIY